MRKDYQDYRRERIKELNSLGYDYIAPDNPILDLFEDEGKVITPSGFEMDSFLAGHYLEKLRVIGKRIQIESLRALELLMLKECEDESFLEFYFC